MNMNMEMATVIAAALAFIASIVSSVFSWYSIRVTKKGNEKNIEANKEISREVQTAENKRNESQIDANIVWRARVEWIQKVRQVTAEFITHCYKYMQSYDKSSKEILDSVEEKKFLLILCFGPDKHTEHKNAAENIWDIQTNNGKNDLIINLVNEIYSQIKVYHLKQEIINDCNQSLSKCAECEYRDEIKQYYCINECEDKFSEDECNSYKNTIYSEKNDAQKITDGLRKNLRDFTEAMRIYLKIEWDNAKHRKNN